MRSRSATRFLLGAFVFASACSDAERHSAPACTTDCGDAMASPISDAAVADAHVLDGTTALDGGSGGGNDAGALDSGKPVVTGPGQVVTEPTDEAVYVFDQSALRTYNIVIAPADLATIDANPAAEQYVNAQIEFEGKTYGPLSVRYKGSIGAFLAPCTAAVTVNQTPGAKIGKCSIKADFNRVDPEGRFFGLKKLNFHAMGLDSSQLRDRLGYAMFREAGVAAPRAVHARILINGKLEGLFAVVEEVDGRFTKQRFTEGGDGNLYKEVWPNTDDPAAYQAALSTNADMPVVDKMLAFKHAIDQGASAMSAFVDLDYIARYLAVDRVITNDDGAFHWYCLAGSGAQPSIVNHNYYWYEAPQAQRLWLIPWDLDSSFESNGYVTIRPKWNAQAPCSCAGNPSQRPAMCDPLTAQWASSGAQYEAAVDAFLAGPFAQANVDAKLTAWLAQIEPVVREASGLKGAPIDAAFQNAVATLRTVIRNAREHRGRQ